MSLHIQIRHGFVDFGLDVDISAPGGVTAVMGPSGAGKTTLVKAVAGIVRPDAGHIAIGETVLFDQANNVSLPAHRRRIGYVFQEPRLFPHMSVARNLGYGARFAGTRAHVPFDETVALLGLERLLDRAPRRLSGGEQQRVALGRALLCDPQLLILDEPLASLDDPRKAEVLPYLERIRDRATCPILYVSHAVSEVARLATTLVVLRDGQCIAQGLAGHVLSNPDVSPVLGPRATGAILEGTLTHHHTDGLSEVETSAGPLFVSRQAVAVGTKIRLRIEAPDVLLSLHKAEGLSAINTLPATVVSVTPDRPGTTLIQIAAGRDRVLASLTRRSTDALDLRPGVKVHAIFKSVSVDAAVANGPFKDA